MKIIFTGGGTGGHVYPALSMAEYFKSQSPDCVIKYVGSENGIENKIVPSYGYEIKTIPVKGLQRKVSLENMKRAAGLLKSMHMSKQILKKEKPDIVIGTGGYVSGPLVYVAAKMGIKTGIHEQNVFPGIANKFLAKHVDHIFAGYEGAKKYFPKEKFILTGNPVRTISFNLDREKVRTELGYSKDDMVVLSVGGSGGSGKLNSVVKKLLPYFVENDISLVHVTGRFHYNEFIQSIKDINLTKKQAIYQYLDEIGKYMVACDLIICSAGASTLSEVNYVGIPSIVIPKAYTAENHQQYNAQMIEDAGGGYCILEKDLTEDTLKEKIDKIISDENLRKEMSENTKKLYNNDCLKIIYDTFVGK